MKPSTKIILAITILALYLFSIIAFSLAGISALTITSVITSPVEVAQGENTNVKIELDNDGDFDLEDVSVSLDLTNVPFAPYSSSSEVSFDELREGKSKTADFRLVALNTATAGIYKIPVHISYTDTNDDLRKTKDSLISVTVNSEPILGINIGENLLLKNSNNQLTIQVVNKGLSDIKFLEINLKPSAYYDILSQNSVYIGDIDSDDFDSADFQIFFKSNSPDTIYVPVTINYKDPTNKQYTEDFSVPVNVYTKDKAIELGLLQGSNTYLYIGIVIALIIIYFIYRYFRRQSKRKNMMNGGM